MGSSFLDWHFVFYVFAVHFLFLFSFFSFFPSIGLCSSFHFFIFSFHFPILLVIFLLRETVMFGLFAGRTERG